MGEDIEAGRAEWRLIVDFPEDAEPPQPLLSRESRSLIPQAGRIQAQGAISLREHHLSQKEVTPWGRDLLNFYETAFSAENPPPLFVTPSFSSGWSFNAPRN